MQVKIQFSTITATKLENSKGRSKLDEKKKKKKTRHRPTPEKNPHKDRKTNICLCRITVTRTGAQTPGYFYTWRPGSGPPAAGLHRAVRAEDEDNTAGGTSSNNSPNRVKLNRHLL